MGDVVDIRERRTKWDVNKIMEDLRGAYNFASDLSEEYSDLLSKNPTLAIRELPKFIERARNINKDRSFVEAVAGGPNQDWIVPFFNILGGIYPFLEREERTEGLKQCLSYLDKLRYDYSQNHVELINEPWLVGDIMINRGLYWCGFESSVDLLQNNKTWEDFLRNKNSIRSEFWLTLAITRPEYSSLEVRTNFYRKFPEILDRTEDAIAVLTFDHSENESKKTGKDIQSLIDGRMTKYDPLLHEDIRRKIGEKKWIKLSE